jgi:superfamily II DNA or RNA helicase
MVAVRMVSEGVDVPRLAVGVYATSTATPLFFAQAIGRYVRARRRGETASIFLPSSEPHGPGEPAGGRTRPRPRPSGDRREEDGFALEDALMEAANREEKASDS